MNHRFAALFFACSVIVGIACTPKATNVSASSALPAEPQKTDSTPSLITFTGRCDGSAAVSVGGKFLATTSDETDDATEENTLAVYDPRRGGAPVATLALNKALALPKSGKRSKKEADLEAATILNGRIYWIASHSLSKDGEERTARYQFFATKEDGKSGALKVTGKPYHLLKQDLLADKALSPFLQNAALRTPEELGGWNIEGMTATPNGRIWIAFRNPIIDGKNALLVPLINPEAVVTGQEAAKFGAAIKLGLSCGDTQAGAELGIRDIAWWAERKQYVILAGSYLPGGDAKARFRILLWDGKSKPTSVKPAIDLSALNAPEAVFVQPGNKKQIMILSDDGTVDACKDKPDDERRFQGMWVTIP